MIVPMTEEHIHGVAEIEKLCFSEPWSEAALKESLDSEFSEFYVYIEDGTVAGYMGLYAVAGEGSVTNVATHPDHRKKGVGYALVQNALRVAEALSLESITLEVRESNIPAQRLYEKCGFERVGVRKNFYKLPKENAVVMLKELKIGN